VKWMLELKDPMAIGTAKGAIDRMFDRAAITAIKVRVFVLFNLEQHSSHTFLFLPIIWFAKDFNLT
jgi:hypothetical protein